VVAPNVIRTAVVVVRPAAVGVPLGAGWASGAVAGSVGDGVGEVLGWRGRVELNADDGADDPEELAIERLEGSRVMAALQQLSQDQREVLLLRMAAGLTAPEVAAALHKTTGAVKALQHRGLASLAVVLGLRGSDLDDAAARLRAWLRRPQPSHHADPTRGHQEGQARRPN
jgi:hypothetical protein